jgi:GntR family transcriptional regulator
MATERARFDPASVVPLYEQAADYVARQIASGKLIPGQKFPDQRELAEEWGVAYQTVRRAMRELHERGLVVSRIGKGTFVSLRPGELAMDLGLRARLTQASRYLPFVRTQKPEAGISSFSLVKSKIIRGPNSGTVARGQFSPGTQFPFLGCAVVQPRKRTPIWLYEDDQDIIPLSAIGITASARERLGITPQDDKISIDLPKIFTARVRTPPALDLPTGASIRVSPGLFETFRSSNRFRTYALLTSDQKMSAPVRIRKRPIKDEIVLAPMFVRILCGITEGSTVQLSELPAASYSQYASWLVARVFRRPPKNTWKRNIGIFLGLILKGARLIDFSLELVLRGALRSQPLAFRIMQANPGDDDLMDTVRLHPAAFAALALHPGGQVILNWAGQRMTARVLEDPNPIDTPAASSPHVLHSASLHLDTGLLPEGFPAHLVVRVPAFIRQSLNIPPATIIEVRRRLRPAVISQLNQLTIPVAGLILAAAAFPAVRGWPLLAGSIAALVLGLAPLRMPRTPRGHWP